MKSLNNFNEIKRLQCKFYHFLSKLFVKLFYVYKFHEFTLILKTICEEVFCIIVFTPVTNTCRLFVHLFMLQVIWLLRAQLRYERGGRGEMIF